MQAEIRIRGAEEDDALALSVLAEATFRAAIGLRYAFAARCRARSLTGPSADIRIKSPNFSEPDIRTTHLIWSGSLSKRLPNAMLAHSWLRYFSCDSRVPADSSSGAVVAP